MATNAIFRQVSKSQIIFDNILTMASMCEQIAEEQPEVAEAAEQIAEEQDEDVEEQNDQEEVKRYLSDDEDEE